MSRHCNQPDLVLYSVAEVLPTSTELISLPVVEKTTKYSITSQGVQVVTHKKYRVLKVRGSVTNGKLVVSVQTGEETPRTFTFENESDFTLVDDLLKGDKIVFLYSGTGTLIDVKIQIVKK